MKKLLIGLVTLLLIITASACSLIPGNSENSVKDKEVTLTLSFGDVTGIYTGGVADDLPQGKGVLIVKGDDNTGWTYDGEWQKGHFEGNGKLSWDDGFRQEGAFKNDALNGQGKEYLKDQLTYEGNYADSNYDGQGTLYNIRGDVIYKGLFVKGFYTENSDARKTRLEPFKAQTTEMSYAEINDNAKNETGKKVKITGQVYQVYENNADQECFSDFIMMLNNDPNQLVQVYYRLNSGEKALTENQKVTVWGTVEYLYTGTTDDGKEVTLPNIEAWSVE